MTHIRKAATSLPAAAGLTVAGIAAAAPAHASSGSSYFVNVFNGLCIAGLRFTRSSPR